MSIGYEDPTVSYARTGRAPLDENGTLVGRLVTCAQRQETPSTILEYD